MARLTPDQVAEKWARRTSGATQDYINGVQAVTTAPGQQAARAQDRLLARFQESVTSGKWAARTSAVPLQDWQAKAVNKGAGRIAAGVQGAQADMQSFMGQLLPAVDAAAAKARALPHATVEDGINRSATFIREMAKFKRR